VKIALYRLLQESLANGYRHSGATEQRVDVSHAAGNVDVRIADNGQGFNPTEVAGAGHLGLAGMRERIEILGGTFSVNSAAGVGTSIHARLSLAGQEDENG
jgi:signal transduction histidine kinase